MAVGLKLTFAHATAEQYDATNRHMNIEREPPEGLIFRCGGPIESGWGIIDVWNSRDAFDRLRGRASATGRQQLGTQGLPRQPEITEFEVHGFTRPWLLQLGRFAVSASTPTLVRAREAVTRLTSSRQPAAQASATADEAANGAAAAASEARAIETAASAEDQPIPAAAPADPPAQASGA